MHGASSKLSSRSWLRVYRLTGLITSIAVILSIIITNSIMGTFAQGINVQGLLVAIITPLALGGPSVAIVVIRQEQLRQANLQLQKLATYDFLTDCLNRGAFAARVDSWLAGTGAGGTGTLLMIDADNFKAINDLYGHDIGDVALTVIARSIRSILREGDLIGRMGGEEFGVFLPGTGQGQAELTAERIRAAVNRARFAPAGEQRHLSVSIGGATFACGANFAELFRIADQRLYCAKNAGRNMAAVAPLSPEPVATLRRSA
ncbi:GGDEF domain-containing protein [Devosia faecipullorum]|uniref:GGDEF domain-containing protein n=1 Tax=Devosia faecipullorum TaxID=2755039 RepID=UPI00187B7FD8|nr:GGDEF domain-containing protein [Devosia faecipullorum]MBE7733235.1 GGDEF domain-containing protein [Devosia faecipullorum]